MEKHISTDVLIIGGGMAGWMAADRVRQAGLRAAVIDKGYIGKCGQSPYARDFFVCSEELGDDPEEVIRMVSRAGEYVDNRAWSELVIRNSYNAMLELESWGFVFTRDENGSLVRNDRMSNFPVAAMEGTGKDPQPYKKTFGHAARRHLEDIGADLYDRVMAVTLLMQDDRAQGAVCISTISEDVYVFEAGAVIMCTGGFSLKAAGYSCVASCTGDGDRMAFEAGADLLGKEFSQPMRASAENPVILGGRALPPGNGISPTGAFPIVADRCWRQEDKPFSPYGGKLSSYPFSYLDLEFETHKGHVPVKTVLDGQELTVVSGGAIGMSVRKADGIWPADQCCRSTVPGLFAAGDALGTMQNGALYMLCGASISGCAVTGAVAGENAAAEVISLRKAGASYCAEPYHGASRDRVSQSVREEPSGMHSPGEEVIRAAVDKTLAPLNRGMGYSPRWAMQLLHNTMAPYFVSYVRKADRLEAALTYVMFIKEHICPQLKAEDMHELRLAHEVCGMVLGSEIRLRSALFRQESRGMHYREDFPSRDDKNWLAWIKIPAAGNGKVVPVKVPVPEEWRTDCSLSYEERYPYRFPGEIIPGSAPPQCEPGSHEAGR